MVDSKNPERDAEILRRWDAGDSAGCIADAIGGITRNVVIGVAHRAGRKRRTLGASRQGEAGRKTAAKRAPRRLVATRAAAVRVIAAAPVPDPVPVIADQKIPLEQRQTILTVRDGLCRFPVGEPRDPDFFLCGAPASHFVDPDGRRVVEPYCLSHMLRTRREREPTPELSG